MSFILDALKKSENDRQRQTAPGMFEVKVAPPKARFPLWAVGLGLLLGINLLVLVGLLLREGRSERAATQIAAAPATESSVASPAANAAPQAPAAQVPVGVATSSQGPVATVTVTVPTGVAPNVTVAPGAQGFPQPGLAPAAGVVAPSAAPPLVEEPVLSSQEEPIAPDFDPADYAPAVSPSAAPRASGRTAGGGLPTRDDVVTSGGPPIPAMRLDLHVYAANPAERFVFVNMRKLREGESLPDGTRVESITPTGAILSYRGTRFTLQSE